MRPIASLALILVVTATSTPALAVANFFRRGAVVLDPVALGGDNDRSPEPGETFDLVLTLGNEGDEIARGITATLTSSDPLLTVLPSSPVSFPDIARGGFGTNTPPHLRLTAAPGLVCGTAVGLDLGIAFDDALGMPRTQTLRFVLFVGEKNVLYADDFDQDGNGWNHDTTSSSGGPEGRWVNAAPPGYSFGGQPAQPGTDVTYPDVSSFYTGISVQPQENVDGTKGLLSRIYDLSGQSQVYLSYSRWFYTDDAAGGDSWTMEASADGGTNWVEVERITAVDNRWAEVALLLDPLLPLTPIMRFRVLVSDGGANPRTQLEAAIDDMAIVTSECSVNAQEARLRSSAPSIDDTLDPSCTDRDGIPDAGETFRLSVTIENSGATVATNASARLVSIPPELTLSSPNPVPLGSIADNGGTARAAWLVHVSDIVSCKTTIALDVTVTADPPSVGTPRSDSIGFEENVSPLHWSWFDDFDSALPPWSLVRYGANDDWAPGLEDCVMNPGTPPTPANNFWYTGSTGNPIDCSVNPYAANDDSAIRSPRIDTGYANPDLLRLRWNQLLTLTPLPDGDAAEVWIDHDDDGVFTRIARYQGLVTANGDTLDPAEIDLLSMPEGADLSGATQFIQLEFRFLSDGTGGGGSPLALGWFVDNVELTWADGEERICDAQSCLPCDLAFADLTFPPLAPTRVAPWVYTQSCASGGVLPALLVPAVVSGSTVDAAGGAPGTLRLYQLACGCGDRIYLTSRSGGVRLDLF